MKRKNSYLALLLIVIMILASCQKDEIPTANFSVDKNSIYLGETVNFADNSTGEIIEYSWTFDGGTPATSTEKNPTIAYNSVGTFSATLVVKNSAGSDEMSKTITVTVSETELGLKETPVETLNMIITAPSESYQVYSGYFPNNFTLEMPIVRSQGQEGSCVAWAVGYGAASYANFNIIGYFNEDGTINEQRVISPEYIYNQIKIGSCYAGAYFVDYNGYKGGLNILVEQGACSWATMPYSDQNGCDQQPNSTQIQEALQYKIKEYQRIPNSNFTPDKIKGLLLNKFPVIIGMEVYENFMNISNYENTYSQKIGNKRGNHAVVIYGYDETRQAYKVFNSWGQDWGYDGSFWLSYDFMDDIVFEAYIIRPEDSPTPPTPTIGVWNAYVESLDSYIEPNENLADVIQNGRAYISPNLSSISYYWTHFKLAIPENTLNGDNLKFEIRLKNPQAEGGLSAYDIGLMYGNTANLSNSAYLIWMGEDWALSYTYIGVGSNYQRPASELIRNFNDYVTVTLETAGNNVIAYYNGVEVKRLPYTTAIGFINYLDIAFKGSGSIDWVKVYQNGQLKMKEEFNTDGQTNIEWFNKK